MEQVQKKFSTISDLNVGEYAEILGFTEKEIPVKFLEMGIIPGEIIRVRCKAPFRGPVCISICKNECALAIRMSEAKCVKIKRT